MCHIQTILRQGGEIRSLSTSNYIGHFYTRFMSELGLKILDYFVRSKLGDFVRRKGKIGGIKLVNKQSGGVFIFCQLFKVKISVPKHLRINVLTITRS